ncbi:MAG: hypothetical protein RIK85_01900 [Marinobacter sp.]
MWIRNNVYFQLLTASLLTIAAYVLGLSGGFYFDDEWNILRNQALQLDSLTIEGLWNAALSGTAGPLGRPLSMLSFALNHVFFGFDPYYFKLVNLLIHLMCGWAMYALVLSLCEYLPRLPAQRRHLFAFLVMLMWLLHPLNLTTVLYPVQRMAGLSAFFCMLGMLAYLHARRIQTSGWAVRTGLYALSFLVFWPLALASKENAALFPVYLFLLELLFLKFRSAGEKKLSIPLVLCYGIFFIFPAVVLAFYYIFYSPEWVLSGYTNRDFTLTERLFTESRVLLFYVSQIFIPVNSSLGLFHDDFSLSRSIFSPWTTFASISAVLLLVIGALAGIRKYPVIAFGILFFFAAHSLESTVFALELVHEHRNYLAMFSILFVIAYYFVVGAESLTRLRALLAVCLVVFLGATTITRAAVWGEPAIHVISEVENHPESPRANYGIGKQYAVYASSLESSAQKADAIKKATEHFRKSADLRSSYTDGLFGLLMLEALEGHMMSEEYFLALLDRLENAPFSNNNYNYLNSIVSCLERTHCEISNGKMAEIINACSDNPGFSGKNRRSILRRYRNLTE